MYVLHFMDVGVLYLLANKDYETWKRFMVKLNDLETRNVSIGHGCPRLMCYVFIKGP